MSTSCNSRQCPAAFSTLIESSEIVGRIGRASFVFQELVRRLANYVGYFFSCCTFLCLPTEIVLFYEWHTETVIIIIIVVVISQKAAGKEGEEVNAGNLFDAVLQVPAIHFLFFVLRILVHVSSSSGSECRAASFTAFENAAPPFLTSRRCCFRPCGLLWFRPLAMVTGVEGALVLGDRGCAQHEPCELL